MVVYKHTKADTMLKSVLLKQLRSLLPTLFRIYIPGLLLLAGAALQRKVPVSHLLRDPVLLTQAPFYAGAISNIGALLWCAAASICLFCAALSRRTVAKQANSKRWDIFLFWSGLITLMLLADDFFLLHEEVYPNYLYISEKIILLAYGVIFLFYLTVFRKTILKTNYLLLLLAFAFFGISIGIDLFDINDSEIIFLIEDGAKFLGIISWFAYFTNLCLQLMQSREPAREIARELTNQLNADTNCNQKNDRKLQSDSAIRNHD